MTRERPVEICEAELRQACEDLGDDFDLAHGNIDFNGVELLQGLPRQLATTDACRLEIGRAAAEIILERSKPDGDQTSQHITLTPKISFGDTLRRNMRA